MDEEKFDVVFHHRGKFVNEGKLIYAYGESRTLSCDPDRWSYFEVLSILKEMGYVGGNDLWYCVGGGSVLEDRLELLSDDRGAMHMVTIARILGEVHLFVVHRMCDEPEIIEMLEYNVGTADGGEVGEVGELGGEKQDVVDKVGDAGQSESVEEAECELDKVGVGGPAHVEAEPESVEGDPVEAEAVPPEPLEDEPLEPQCLEPEAIQAEPLQPQGLEPEPLQAEPHGQHTVGTSDRVAHVDSWSDSGRHGSTQESVHGIHDEGLVDVSVDADVEHEPHKWQGTVPVEVGSIGEELGGPSTNNMASDSTSEESHIPPVMADRGLLDNEWHSEFLDSDAPIGEGDLDDTDDSEEGYGKFDTFSMPKSMSEYKWEVGTYFAEKSEFVDAIRTYALENGRSLKIFKSDKRRVRVKCLGPDGKCPWYAYCGYMSSMKMWQLRIIIDQHTCNREFNIRLINSKWLSKRLEKTVRSNPKTKGVEIREKVSRKYNIGISRCMAYRAKAMAEDNVEGSFAEQYKRLYDYAHELLRTNPGSTVKLKVHENEGQPMFQRFYACFQACKESFMSCRPIIGLDGCFLKGKYGGELLTAVGRYGNEQMLPIAYAVVEVENKDSWTWFLELLIEDIGGTQLCTGCTWISDQQKVH